MVGLDVIADRCKRAEQAGAAFCASPDGEGMAAVQQVLGELTGGRGADHVFLAAGGSSNGPVEAAVKLARDRARVVDIGKTRLDLPWNAYYDKELDVRFSRSYGPGRYDDRYELKKGIDYPAGYVRWTERRNIVRSASFKMRKARSVMSSRFPIGVATTYKQPVAIPASPAFGFGHGALFPARRSGGLQVASLSHGFRAALHALHTVSGHAIFLCSRCDEEFSVAVIRV